MDEEGQPREAALQAFSSRWNAVMRISLLTAIALVILAAGASTRSVHGAGQRIDPSCDVRPTGAPIQPNCAAREPGCAIREPSCESPPKKPCQPCAPPPAAMMPPPMGVFVQPPATGEVRGPVNQT